jgi:hypothetical protein
MAQQAATLIAAAALALALLAAPPAHAYDPNTPRVPWSQLSPQEQRILGPVAPDWERMPGFQQQRLRASARRYPSMQPVQRERFENRVRDWSAMTPEQRRAARETFQGFHRLRWMRERSGGRGRPPGR